MEGTLDDEALCARARELFAGAGYACSEAVLAAANERMDDGRRMPDSCIRTAAGFGGGLAVGDVCGALCGGVMALSLAIAKVSGSATPEEKEERRAAVRRLYGAFAERFGTTACRELTAEFEAYDDPGRKAKCAEIVEAVARDLARMLGDASQRAE